jgi:exosortase
MSFLILSQKKNNLLILLLLLICAVITYPSSLALISEWKKWDQALSHGFACLALFVFFIWRQPFYIDKSTNPSVWILSIILVLNSIGWCLSQLGNLQLPGYVFALNNYWLLIAGFFGWRTARGLIPLLILFIFALPVWSIFNDALVALSSKVVALVLGYTQLTLYIQDNQFMTPWGTIVIADGCSGLRYFVISLLLAYLLCLINPYSLKMSIGIFIIAALLGLLTNWLRIIIIVFIGYYTEMQHSLVRDHEFFGWILFASILFPALYLSPQYKSVIKPVYTHPHFSWLWIIAAGLGPLIYFSIPFNSNTNPINLSALGIYSSSSSEPPIQINFPDRQNFLQTSIRFNETIIHIDVTTHAPLTKSEKVVPYIGQVYDGLYWRSITRIKLKNSQMEIVENRTHQQKILLMYRFQVGSFTTGNYYQAKLLQIPAKLFNQSYFGFWLAQTTCQSNCESEIKTLQQLNDSW